MKINIKHEQLANLSIVQFMRQAAYQPLSSRFSDQTSFVRRLGRDFYPRFHAYINNYPDHLIINLHLDQKKASYTGQTAHSGEYQGELVEREAERLQSLLTNINIQANGEDKKAEKTSFWQRLFI